MCCRCGQAIPHTGLRPEARYCAKHLPAGPASRARLALARRGQAARQHAGRGEVTRDVSRDASLAPHHGSHDSAARDRLRARAAPRGLRASPVRHRLGRQRAAMRRSSSTSLSSSTRSSPPPRGSNPRRPSRQPHGASNPRGETSRDTSLSSSLSPADPTLTRSNSSIALDGADGQTDSPEQTRERRAPRLRSGASRSPPTRLLQSPPGGGPLFSRRKLVHLSTGLDKGEGLPDEALRAGYALRSSLLAQPLTPRRGVNFRAAQGGQFSSGLDTAG